MRARLRAGANVLIGRLPEKEHYYWAVLNAWTERPVRVDQWRAAGPFGDAGDVVAPPSGWDVPVVNPSCVVAPADRFEAIWQRGTLDAADESLAVPLTVDMIAPVDVFALSASDRVVPGVAPRVNEPSALFGDNGEWATIHPVDNADIRLLFDFGDEVVGFQEFESDATAGAHNFEFIQPDGRFNLCEGTRCRAS